MKSSATRTGLRTRPSPLSGVPPVDVPSDPRLVPQPVAPSERPEGSHDIPTGVSAEATIDLAAVAHNARLLARAARPGELMAIVKADGFGHGAVPVARTALANGARWLGVTSVREALALRRAHVDAPMLMWMFSPQEELDALVAADVDVSVSSLAHLASVVTAAQRAGRTANIHLKVDTGLARAGAVAGEWPMLVFAAAHFAETGTVRVRGIWSHLANAELAVHPSLDDQRRAFLDALRVAREAGVEPPLRHLANSAAVLQRPDTVFDLGRTGIALYGIEPVPGRTFGLRAAMTLQARVILTKRVPAGTPVSYGHEWVTERETTLALIPLGFADGVPRRAGAQASVLLGGVRCPVAGRVSMDQFVVDAGDLPVAIGDVAVVFGPGDRGEPTAADWAEWADTNPHEVVTGISARVPRRHLPDDDGHGPRRGIG